MEMTGAQRSCFVASTDGIIYKSDKCCRRYRRLQAIIGRGYTVRCVNYGSQVWQRG